MLTVLLLALLASNDGILAFPGTTYTGKIVAGDNTACRLTLWDGMAPYFPLLSAEERKQLEAAVKDVETKWPQAGSWRERAALISPYYHVLFDKNRELPFRRKFATYQQIALTCGNDTVRGVAVDLPPMGAGGLVVLKHPVQPEYVVFVDVAPQAQEALEDIGAFVARYRAQLEKAERPDELPAEARKEMAALQKRVEQKGSRRLQFWDVNGMVLPTCPGACPPGTLAYAFGQLSPEAKRAFSLALGVLALPQSRAGGDEPSFGRLVRLSGTWPAELGENRFVGAKEELQPLSKEPISFSPPNEEIARELWGRPDPSLPTFDGDLKRTIRDILKSF